MSVLGLLGIIYSKRWPLLLSFALIAAYLVVSYRDYYAILFTPLLVAGVFLLLQKKKMPAYLLLPVLFAGTVFCLLTLVPALYPGPASKTMELIQERGKTGTILISGPFGHEWQYESPFTILRYNSEFLPTAQAVICLEVCPSIDITRGWERLKEAQVETWVKE